MYKVEVYLRVRRAVMVEEMSIREAARSFALQRDTVRKTLPYRKYVSLAGRGLPIISLPLESAFLVWIGLAHFPSFRRPLRRTEKGQQAAKGGASWASLFTGSEAFAGGIRLYTYFLSLSLTVPFEG